MTGMDDIAEFVFIMMTVLRTLAPHGSHPDLTVLPAETRAVLQRLADMPEVSEIPYSYEFFTIC